MTIEFQGYTFTTEQAVVYGLIAVGVLLALYWVLFTRTNHLPVTSHTTSVPPDPGATPVTTTNASVETEATTATIAMPATNDVAVADTSVVTTSMPTTSAGASEVMDQVGVIPAVTPASADATVTHTDTATNNNADNKVATTDTAEHAPATATTTPATMDHQALQQVPQELGKNLTPQAQEAHQQQFGANLPPAQSEQILSIYEQIDSGKLKIAKYARAYLCILMLGYLLKNTGKATPENAQELENYTIAVFLHAFKPALFNYNTNEIVHDQQVRDNANLLIKQCHYYYSWGMNVQTDQEVMLEFIDALASQLLPVEHSYEDILYQSLNVYNVYKKVFRIYSYVTGQNLPDTPSNRQVLDHLKHKFKLDKFKFEVPFF